MATFKQLGVSAQFTQALEELNIITPTPIQEKAIPFLLEKGTDLIAQAQTGTGKTAAFGLPILQKVNPEIDSIQALILSPTRELCQQIAKQLFKMTKYGPKVYTEAVYGGAHIGDQVKALLRPTQIVVATPGRLVDLLARKDINLSNVKTVVLDEADEMLKMGFKKDLDQILMETGKKKNTWLFSATMPDEIKQIINAYMSPTALKIQVDKENQVNKGISHQYVVCDDKDKLTTLIEFIKFRKEDERGVIFCRTKNDAQLLAKQLIAKNISADAIHGDLLQKERDKVMRAFKGEKLSILIATDIAARGIDIEGLAYVVHYQLPDQLEYYTHRSGRTARAGKKGISLAIINNKEIKKIKSLETALNIKISELY